MHKLNLYYSSPLVSVLNDFTPGRGVVLRLQLRPKVYTVLCRVRWNSAELLDDELRDIYRAVDPFSLGEQGDNEQILLRFQTDVARMFKGETKRI